MTRNQIDSQSFDGTITNGGTETLEVDTSRGDNVVILVDDGNTDNKPNSYDMTQRVYVSPVGSYLFYDKVTSEQSRAWTDNAWGEKMELVFENVSGSDANYRIVVIVYRQM